ncbi:sulfite exporter TauE/SafE family protein [Litorimonas sp. RW-G-Af-16]|uniref:sulfite exporter TauE/SafE family protein n=1 Tax=Litorimonas sp. RW-G-Af-16 TaxID=3241168 RepID=UPI00390C914A
MLETLLQYLPLILTLLAVGAVAGLSAGLFGIGGGAVMVPALFFAFTALGIPEAVTMHCAVATSSAIIIVNAVRSVRSHQSHGAVDWDLLWPKNPLLSYALWIGLGAFIAALWLAPRLSGEVLTILFAAVASLVALQFIFGRPDWQLRPTVPGGLARPVIGGGVGALSSLMGIGGGSLTVPLMSICGVPIHKAVGTASGFGLAIALPATIGFVISGWGVAGRPPFSLGYVNGLGFALVASVAFLTIPMGAKLAHAMSQRKLKLVFGICLLLVALNMARKALT